MRGIDHLVLCGRDLEALRTQYAALGFTLTPPARHPFGTGNSLVQLESCFLELLSVIDLESIPEQTPDRFSFAAFNRDFLGVREGLSMLVLDSRDARADAASFRSAGLRTYEPFDFSRKAQLPDGSEATVGFSLAFVTHPDMPHAAFFTCQQHAPEHFWKPEYQRHINRALMILEVCLVAEKPQAYAAFLSALTGVPAERGKAGSVTLRTARGNICCRTPRQFEESYAQSAPDMGSGPCFGGYTIGVRDIAKLERAAAEGGIKLRRHGSHRASLPANVNGSAIAFFALNRQDSAHE